MKAKYFIPLLGALQTACGLALLTNRFVPLALIVLFPINLNIFFFHAVLEPTGLIMGILVLVLNIFLMYAYREHYLHFKNAEAKHSHH
jgi:hypothetical protein